MPSSSATTRDNLGEGMRFLRIQKTGSRTLGAILKEHCLPTHLCEYFCHEDWTQTHANSWTGPIVTLLRDPVERTLSEFIYLRTTEEGERALQQPQWNFKNQTWAEEIRKNHIDQALEIYLHGYPGNPSVNRQALYLLGFDSHYAAGEKYNWNRDHDYLLDQAKANLDRLTAFGITDCFLTSMKVIARQFGWPESEVIDEAKSHQGFRHKDVAEDKTTFFQHSKFYDPHIALNENSGSLRWRDIANHALVEDIEKTNAVDMQLFEYARQRFQDLYGETC